MKNIVKVISAFFATGVLLTSCERIDIEGIGELNKIVLWYSPYTSDAAPLPEDSVLIDHVEKDLGISLTAVPLPSSRDEQNEMILEAARNGSLPDIFMVNREVLTTLVKENHVARVDGMYTLMPERTGLMYDENARAVAAFDGVDFGLAQSGSVDKNEGVLIRKDWLDKLGLPIPTTLDDFYNVMKAFSENDPDGDGLDNTYGYGAYIDIRNEDDGLGCRFAPFFGAFGVDGTFNVSKDNPGLNIHKPEFKQALNFIHRIVSEKLVDPNWALYTRNDFRKAWKAGKFGIMREQNAALALEANYKDFDDKFPNGEWILINPPVGPEGYSSVGAYAPSYRIYAVSRRAQELGRIPVIARLLEWMSTDGYITVVYGEEAENYMIDDEGAITTEGLPDMNYAYNQKAAAPLLQLRNMVFCNTDEELIARYPTWYTQNGREMSAFRYLRQMQKCPWTITIRVPDMPPVLKEFYEDGLRDFVADRLDMKIWDLWLQQFDSIGGLEWERECIAYAEENALFKDKIRDYKKQLSF